MALTHFLVPPWAGQCCHVQGAIPFWDRSPHPLGGLVWSQRMFKAGSLVSRCCRCEGEFGDKIKGSPAHLGLCDVLPLKDNYPAQPLLPSWSFQSSSRAGRTKGKGRTQPSTALFPTAHKAALLLFPLKPGVISCAVAI